VTLTFDLFILKVVSESLVTWATSVPILVFLGLSVLDYRPDVRERQTSDRQTDVRQHCLMPPPRGHNKQYVHQQMYILCCSSLVML